MAKAEEVDPAPGIIELLPGAQFMDAYRVRVTGTRLDAREAARRMFASPPAWVSRLLALRNAIVAPLGLKTGRETATTLVRTHNLLDRSYLSAILPFHRMIVRACLIQF